MLVCDFVREEQRFGAGHCNVSGHALRKVLFTYILVMLVCVSCARITGKWY